MLNFKSIITTGMVLCIALTGLAGAAIYDWTGGASNGLWPTPANWSVTGSASGWTHPNDQWNNEYTNEDCDQINILNGDVVTMSGWLSIDGARDGSNTAVLTIDNGSTLNSIEEMWLADSGGTHSVVNVLNGSSLVVGTPGAPEYLKVADDPGSVATLNIIDSNLTLSSNMYVSYRAGGTGTVNIGGNSTVDIANYMLLVNNAGSTGYLNITGSPTINMVSFYMNDDSGTGPTSSEVVMDGGTVNMTNACTFNDDTDGTATFTLNGGSWNVSNALDVSDNLDGRVYVTINAGEMISGGLITLGRGGGTDIGQVRIYMNGGLLQGEDLAFVITDSKIIFSDGWGKLRILGSAVSETDMQGFIDSGNIDVSALVDYTISTDGDYTVLTPVPGVAGIVAPLAGVSGVPVTTKLEWLSPEAYVQSGFRVYFGTDPNEQSPGWYGNNEIVSGDNVNEIDPAGDLEYLTTYYWRVDALEPNTLGTGFIVHEGMLWNFTTAPAFPVVTADPVNQTVAIGATAVFTVSGQVQTSYEWFDPDGQPIVSDGSKYTIVSDDATSTLSILGAAVDDEGLYYCTLINDAGETPTNTARLMTERKVAQWNFDGNLLDSEDDHDGQPFGQDPDFAPGMIDDALQLYAAGEAVTVAYDIELNTDNFSVATWAQVTGSQGVYRAAVSNRDDGPARGFIIYATSGDKWQFWTGPGWHSLGSGDAVTDVVPGEWIHIVGTFEATEILPNDSSTGVKRLYVNGVLAAEDTDVSYQTNGRQDLLIGAGANEDPEHNYFFDGLLDDTRLYSYAMDRYEVGELFAAGKGEGACVDRPLGDFSGDCVMGLADIALLVTGWLDCGWHPSAGCL